MSAAQTIELTAPRTVRRIVVLGDPHGDSSGLDAALAAEGGGDALVISAGDNVGYADAETSARFCRRLSDLGIRSVRGNHEEWIDEHDDLSVVASPAARRRLTHEAAEWCRALPRRIDVKLGGRSPSVAVVHALRMGDDWEHVTSANADLLADIEGAQVIFCGHSHRPAIYVIGPEGDVRTLALAEDAGEVSTHLRPGHRYVADAGSLGRPRFSRGGSRDDLATCATFDVASGRLSVRAIEK